MAEVGAPFGTRFAISDQNIYLSLMRSTFHPCLPTGGKAVPSTPVWLHKVKYDGYRLRLEWDGECG